jgi:thiol:disulfide interchange protein
MRGYLTIAALGFLAFGSSSLGDVDWASNYDTALQRARKDNKLVMVDLYTDWCGWCKKLDRDTYSDKDVADKLARDFVAVKLNPEKSPTGAKLAQQFGTRGYPHVVFVNASGSRVSEIQGFLPPKEFLKQLIEVSKQAAKR